MIFGNAVARHNEPYDRLAEECVKRRLLIVGVVSGGTAEGHERTTCLVIRRSARVEQGLQDRPSAPQTAPAVWPPSTLTMPTAVPDPGSVGCTGSPTAPVY